MSQPTHTPRVLSSFLIGEFSRFRLEHFQGRYGDTDWFLYDGETLDADGLPACVMQGTEEACRAIATAAETLPYVAVAHG